MEIWIIKTGEPLPINGNRRWRAGQLSRALAQRGHKVTLWASTFSHHQKAHIFAEQTTLAPGPCEEVVCLHGPAYRRNISLARIINHKAEAHAFTLEAKRRPRPDLIVACMPTLDLAEAASAFAKAHGVPFIVDIRDRWPDVFVWALPRPLRPLGAIMFAPLYLQLRRILNRADCITSAGEGMLKWAQGHARDARRPDRMFRTGFDNPVLSASQRSSARAFWRKQGLLTGDKILALGASLNSQSCAPLPDVVRAFVRSRPKGWRLVICGTGSLEPAVREAAADCPAVIMTGWVGQPELTVLLEEAAAALLPYLSRPDFMGVCVNKIGEYLGMGLPVLTSLKGESRRVITEGGCGWSYDSPAELIDLLNAITDKELKDRAKAATTVFEAQFAPERVANAFASHALLLARPSRRSAPVRERARPRALPDMALRT